MKYKEFWKSYKNKSETEKRAIDSIKKAMAFLFENVPKNKIMAVYIKGTFVTRELNDKSDVDIVPILADNKTLRKFKIARNKFKEFFRPSELLPISLEEIRRNRNMKGREMKGRPDTFLRDLEYHKLIYGRPLGREDYPMRGAREIFIDEIMTLKNRTIGLYTSGAYGFSQLIKQVFWIVYHEQEQAGKSPPRTWNGLNKFVNDKNHLIHKAYYFRMHPTKDKRKRDSFIVALDKYLNKLIANYV